MNTTPQTMPERLWKVQDVMQFLDVSENWVYAHVADGSLPYTRVGGLIRFWPSEIHAYARGESVRKQATAIIRSKTG